MAITDTEEKKDFLIGYTLAGSLMCKCPHPECNKCSDGKYYIISPDVFRKRQKENLEPCTKLLPVKRVETKNTRPERFVKSILDDVGIEYKTKVQDVIPKGELDIYIQEKKLAIECNGICDENEDKKCHLEKTTECQLKGITLIQIWEDQIVNKPDIVKSMIINRLGLTKNRIYARKCEIKDVSPKMANVFLEQNHIQGGSMASVRLGLFYNNELVSLMTFGKKRGCMGNTKIQTEGEWELVRFCSKLNTQIPGAAGKLFDYFKKQYKPKIIYSFASRDISHGHVYEKLGFKSDGKVTSSYWYIEPFSMRRYHRSAFTKSAIIRRGWCTTKDGWTEGSIMKARGYIKLVDAGQTKWIYECKR